MEGKRVFPQNTLSSGAFFGSRPPRGRTGLVVVPASSQWVFPDHPAVSPVVPVYSRFRGGVVGVVKRSPSSAATHNDT